MVGAFIPYAIILATGYLALSRGAPYAVVELLAIMAIWYSVRTYLTWGKPKPVTEERDRAKERLAAWSVFAGMVVLPLLTLATPLFDFAAYAPLPGQIILGILVSLAGCYVFWCSHRDLGKYWSAHLEVREGHKLITEGIYGHVRHPMYTAIFVITFGQVLLLPNWLIGPSGLVFFTILYLGRVGSEEDMMESQFGDQWREFSARTPRLFPSLFK